MRNAVRRALMKKLLIHSLVLLLVMGLVLLVTSLPTDFDLRFVDGAYVPTHTLADVGEGLRENLRLFRTGAVFTVDILGETTGAMLVDAARKSIAVLFFGALLAVMVGIPKGILDSRKRSRTGTLKLLQSLIPLSVPDILVVSLIQIGAIYLFKNEMPFLGIGPIEFVGDGAWYHAIYPILSIALLPAAYIARITATAIEDGFERPYVLAARGKGCSRMRIIRTHLMPGVLFDVLSSFPTVIAIMFSSLVIVERLFYFRGVGYHLVQFYATTRIPVYEAGVGFTLFIAAMALFYYFVFMGFNALKEVVLPRREGE